MEAEKITQDDIHNYHVRAVNARLNEIYSQEILAEIVAAHYRHHEQGTSCRDEADALNRKFGLTA